MRNSKQVMVEKLKEGVAQWIKLSLFFVFSMLIIRVVFYFQLHIRNEVEASQFVNIMKGFIFDVYLLCHSIAWLAIPFLLFYLFFPKATSTITVGLVIFYTVVSALLTEYFCNLNMPLDHVILVYTPEEVKGTATSSANISIMPFLWFIGTLGLVVFLWFMWRKVKVSFAFSAIMMLVAVITSLCVPYKQFIRDERYFNEHSTFCLVVNQPSYSYIKLTDYIRQNKMQALEDGEVSDEVLGAIQRYQQLHDEFQFVDKEFPFYRKADDPDVLGGFIEKTTDSLPPNFVFVIMESFGQRLTGVDHPGISFTPFIDSLKQEGLYWQNCLSTSERTFGVLPSIFASAPYGKFGFCVTWKPMPYHNSLLRDLKNNGYETSYYYGGIHAFDRYDGFLKANKMDFIYVPDEHDLDTVSYKLLNENHRWGLEDRETFQYVMQRKATQPSSRPNIDIIMTLTTHEPFLFNGVEAYEEKVMNIVDSYPNLLGREKNNVIKNLNIFACYFYLDECVRELMAFYKNLPEYENTIFIFTGDHRMSFLGLNDVLTKYNVPLLIYSPMIHHPKAMNAVVSHLDITPTLNAYLHANYDYQIDDYCHWLGTALDTVEFYRNMHKQAFMLNNRDVVDYINGANIVSNNHFFKLDEDLLSHYEEDNKEDMERLKSELYDFNLVSQFAVHHNHLNRTNGKMELLRHENYDFESDYSAIFRQFVMNDGDNHFVSIDSTVKLAPLFEDLKMMADYEDVMVDISFDLQSLDTSKELPPVIVQLGTYYMGLKLESEVDAVSLNTGRVEHYVYHLSIPVQQDCTNQYLKIYLLNQSQSCMNYDNVKICVNAVRKSLFLN